MIMQLSIEQAHKIKLGVENPHILTDTLAFTADQDIIASVLYFTSTLSVIGAGFIILTYILFKETRSYGTHLIFMLSLSDFFNSIAWYPWNATPELCVIQATMLQFFQLASYFWSFCIALSLFMVFYLQRPEEGLVSYRVFFHLLSWFYPAVSVIFCLIFDTFGPQAGSWCWIKEPQDPSRLWVYTPLLLFLLLNTVIFLAIRLRLGRFDSSMSITVTKRLNLYLLAFVGSQLPALVNYIQNYYMPEEPILFLYILQAIFQPCQGFFNGIVYGIQDPQFAEQYKLIATKWGITKSCTFCCGLGCCKRRSKATTGPRLKSGAFVPTTPEESLPLSVNYDYESDEE